MTAVIDMPLPAVRRSIRLRLLDGFEVSCDGRPYVLQPGSQRLVAFLAICNRALERAYVAFRLWPDKPEERAIANLRSALWRLRDLPVPVVRTSARSLRLDESVVVDTHSATMDVASSGGCELLPDWYDDWLTVERERLRQVRLHALEQHARSALANGAFDACIDLALRAIAIEPLRESAHRILIEAHLAEGNLVEARRQYAALRHSLHHELDVAPSAALDALMATGLPRPA